MSSRRLVLAEKNILFVDARSEIVDQVSQLRATAQLFAPLAAWLNVEPATIDGFVPGHPKADAMATQMANFSRATALAQSGDGRQFKNALQRLN